MQFFASDESSYRTGSSREVDGDEMIAKVDVTFHSGQKPVGAFEGSSTELMADQVQFGSSRKRRWFGS